MTSKGLYQTPLDASKSEIRLLELINDDDTISGKLHTVTFNDSLRFAALSYVWGNAADRVNIEIDGIQIPVSKGLADALKHVRKYWKYEFPDRDQSEFRIWVDAVCINQADEVERTEQVKLMHSIYSSADLVLGWLGAEDEERIMAGITTITVLGSVFRAAGWDMDKLMDLHWLKNIGLATEPGCNKFWNSLDYLGTLPYWQRVWILQENVLASTLFYITPRMSIEYRTLMNVIIMFNELSLKLIRSNAHKPEYVPTHIWMKFFPPEGTGFIQIRNMLRFDWAKSMSSAKTLETSEKKQKRVDLRLAEYGGGLLATDPRDHIYGLLGLSSIPMEPDYTKTVKEVYIDYCRALLSHQQGFANRDLSFLRDSGSGVFENPLPLPSWAPQYPSRASGIPTLMFGGGLKLVKVTPAIPAPTISGSTLRLSGVRLQTLKRVGGHPQLKKVQKGGDLVDWIQDYIKRIPFYATKIPSLWVLFLVVTRMQRLVFDTLTMLLLLNFTSQLDLEIPESDRPTRVPTYFTTREVEGLSVVASLDGGNNPQLMACVSPMLCLTHPAMEPNEVLNARMFDISARLVFMLERNYHTRLFETDTGYLGMGPEGCEPGDMVCIVDGYEDLVLLRKQGDEFEYIGPCMGYGITDMYIKRRFEAGEVALETFNLV